MPIFHDILDESSTLRLPGDVDEQNGSRTEAAWWERRASMRPDARTRVAGEDAIGEQARPFSRDVVIERLKRGASPRWSFKNGFATRPPSDDPSPSEEKLQRDPIDPLLPPAELEYTVNSPNEAEVIWSPTSAGMDIERPKSALHSGDFRDEKGHGNNDGGRIHEDATPLSTSPVAPWHTDFPAFLAMRDLERRAHARPRAPTQPSLSQFMLMPPTSPLVQSTYNSDLEDQSSQPVPQRRAGSPYKENRRHTFSPRSLQAYGSEFAASSPTTPQTRSSVRREGTFPYRAHQPRRSITSIAQLSQSISSSTPQTPLLRPRGLTNTSESSPLHHAPMVGSYEESILRGRMSTTPSRPLDFVAQIGVLGKGKCKSSLRCPPHAVVPFPAVFYSYGSGGGRLIDNQPSPYVGLIDIENSIPPPRNRHDESHRPKRYVSPATTAEQNDFGLQQNLDTSNLALMRKREKLRKRSQSPKAPPGGSYRIPQQGQLQIIIKNPNKTAVKLFLVPYDLTDMEPGQKTFIRQRSYSAGPIIDMPLSARTNLGTDRPEAALSNSEDPRDRPVLRYLIHLHICCTSKGRYYLYKSIRVVFANRVPDGKEKLRNEIQLPEPKYSVYKASREAALSQHQNPATFALSSTKALASERAARRRSTPIDFVQNESLDAMDGLDWSSATRHYVKPIPFMLPRLQTVESRPTSRGQCSAETESSPFAKKPLSATVSAHADSAMSVSPMSALFGHFATASGRNDPNSAWVERRQNQLLSEHSLLEAEPPSFSIGMAKGSITANPMQQIKSEGLLARQLRDLGVERE